ncbi:MAG: hypothetical protein KC766_24380, partial [Myxococcales bacterium]|nr:hypothetical protein [Myxococcales bacterium]
MRGIGWSLLLAVTGVCTACDGADAEVVSKPVTDAGTDARAPRDAETDGPSTDGGEDAALDAPADAPTPAVRIGVEPEPRAGDEGFDAALRIAQLESLSAGSRAVSIDVRWDELMNDELELRAASLASLGARIRLVRDSGAKLSLCLALVERAVDARPSSDLGWNTTGMTNAVRRVIDAVLELAGDELRFLSLGLESDRYFRALPPAIGSGFVQGM